MAKMYVRTGVWRSESQNQSWKILNRATEWLSTCCGQPSFLSPLSLTSTSFSCLSSSLSAHLFIPLGLRLLLHPCIICSSGTPAVDAAVNSPCSHPPLQFCWAGLMSSLPYRRKVMHPSPKWWRRKRWGCRAGEGSIWLVNFNATADVSLCTCETSGLENILCYDHMSDCLSYLLSRGHYSYMSTCGLMCWWKGIFSELRFATFMIITCFSPSLTL